jgi:hypothetical protein
MSVAICRLVPAQFSDINGARLILEKDYKKTITSRVGRVFVPLNKSEFI